MGTAPSAPGSCSGSAHQCGRRGQHGPVARATNPNVTSSNATRPVSVADNSLHPPRLTGQDSAGSRRTSTRGPDPSTVRRRARLGGTAASAPRAEAPHYLVGSWTSVGGRIRCNNARWERAHQHIPEPASVHGGRGRRRAPLRRDSLSIHSHSGALAPASAEKRPIAPGDTPLSLSGPGVPPCRGGCRVNAAHRGREHAWSVPPRAPAFADAPNHHRRRRNAPAKSRQIANRCRFTLWRREIAGRSCAEIVRSWRRGSRSRCLPLRSGDVTREEKTRRVPGDGVTRRVGDDGLHDVARSSFGRTRKLKNRVAGPVVVRLARAPLARGSAARKVEGWRSRGVSLATRDRGGARTGMEDAAVSRPVPFGEARCGKTTAAAREW